MRESGAPEEQGETLLRMRGERKAATWLEAQEKEVRQSVRPLTVENTKALLT